MSKRNINIPNRKLEEFSDLAINSTIDNITNSSKEEFNNKQKEISNYPNNNNNNDFISINEDIADDSKNINDNENIESLYEQLIKANEAIQLLNQENFDLKQVIENKDSIISEYEETFRKTTQKMLNIQKINENLKNEVHILKQNNYEYQKNKDIKNIDNLNNNQYLLNSINDIKNNLGIIEENYIQKISEKEDIINKLNYDLQINYDYKNQVNNLLNQIYCENNDLKTKICCLLKEKEILLNEKEKDHNEIIKLNEILKNIDYFKNNNIISELKKENKEKENNYINMLKNQEKEYILQISTLQRAIVEREKEIEVLKEKYQDIIMKLNIDNESLRNKIYSIENLPIKNKNQLICDNNIKNKS